MNPKITKLIDQYLNGTLDGEDKIAFEKEFAQSAELRQEVELQRSIMDAAARASQRREVNNAAKRYRRKKLLRNGGFSALIAVVVASAVLFFTNTDKENESTSANEMAPITAETRNKLDKNQDFENIPIQYFQIPQQGTVHLSEQGVLISVPEAAFLKNGSPYRGNVILQYQEAIRGVDIIKSGLSTMTGDELLETQGMFSVTGYTEDGEALHFNPEVGVYIQAPVDNCESGMQLYDGEKKENGSIDWVDPQPLGKIPVQAKMADLNFYPEGYEDHLDQEKWKRDKRSRDSLYLSLEHSMDSQEMATTLEATTANSRPLEEGVIVLQKDMGRVFQKRDKTKENLPGIDESIQWIFSRKLLGNNVWQITASAIIADGFYIPTLTDPDSTIQTQLKINTTSRSVVIEQPSSTSQVRKIRTSSGTVNGYTNEVIIQAKVKVTSRTQIRLPLRVVFKLSSADMAYSRVIRGADVSLWESPEQRTARLDSLANYRMDGEFILPSNVMAFWKPAFENTLLSTLEFEQRMQAIHKTCDNEVLELYTDNLNKPMSEIDRDVVKMGYPEFEQFANENIGATEVNDPHLALLNEFYEKSSNMLREDARNTAKSEENRMQQWNKIIRDQEEKDRNRAVSRNLQYSNNMSNFSRKNLRQQYKNTQGFKIRTGSNGAPRARKNLDAFRPYAGVPLIDQTGIMNKALEVTVIRQKIKYNDLKVRVSNFKQFDDVYLYLFADEINSYQRIDPDSSGAFACMLQDKITYAIGIVGITSEGFSYYDHDFLTGGNLGSIQLEPISEEALEARIEKMNSERLAGNVLISGELNWLRTKRKNYKVQQMYKNNIEFRREVKGVIFPCVTFERIDGLRAESNLESELQVIEE
ncbi:hypothetical protein N9Y60_02645 [Crocinitomicaceae bacterium]|nr:hypothetical protein [Crocinitomicaceae bacterium]